MKSLKILIIITFFISMNACVDAQLHKTIRGDGEVVRKERTTSSFDGIQVSTGIDVSLKQGDKESITVEADENLHEYIRTDVRDGVLHVYTDGNIRYAKMKKVYLTTKEVKSLKTSSAGNITGETPLKVDNLKIEASSAGDIKVEVYGKNIEVNISSSGDVVLSGEAQTLEADLSSAGNLRAFGLKVKEVIVNVSSAGDARINVSERLVARASSAGDISYQGNPKYVNAHSSSAGNINSRQ